ncbi:MAG: helicase C-terminal domain-containing protein [Phototrophicaceae bacterium]
MRGELVALDLETTGLNPATDEIIEVGAVRLRDGQIIDEFSTMVNPDVPIPPYVTYLTGIQHKDVISAPSIQAVLPQISAFVGSAPVIAHNISLDMGFMQERHHILLNNRRIDTYDLASVLLPGAARYNLNSLTTQVGIELEHAHRALDDARATALLYWALWQKARALPYATLYEISQAATGLDWDAAVVFASALQEQQTTTPAGNQAIHFEPYTQTAPPLQPAPGTKALDIDAVDAVFADDGPLAASLPGFQPRRQQQQMARAITEAFNNAHHMMIEAGTGAGKSLAYLFPAALWAATNQRRVVISTDTITLQDQLIQHDIPAVQAALDRPLTASVMKGRANYLCPRRLETARRRRPSSIVELRTLAKILVWLLESSSGDRGEINLRGPMENSVWQRLSAQDEGCSLHRCQASMHGACPFYKARKAAESAHLLVVNHALLVSDANSDNQVLPEYHYAVIDEAHHLEDAVTSGMSFHMDKTMLLRRLADLGGPGGGLLGELLASVRPYATEKELARLEIFVQGIGEAATMMRVHVDQLFKQLLNVLTDNTSSRPSDFGLLVRLDHQHRRRLSFANLQSAWQALDEFFEVIGSAMQRLSRALLRLEKHNIPDLPDLISSADTAARYMQEMRDHLRAFVFEPDSNSIYWITQAAGADSAVIHTAPLHIGPMIARNLWDSKASVILTSATLRTQDNFNFIQERLHADGVDTLEVGSPFDYHDSTLLYIPTDIPEPADRQGYQRAVERGIIELAASLEGRILVLFTSYTQLRQTAQAITPRLALGNITVYDQSDGSSRQALLDGFRTTDKAVLLGTRSFWEGIDIAGDALSALVIVRLPFAVPTDPVFAARSDTYSDAFNQYALPEAILRFRQGFGRLIRSHTDRGIVTIFDSRISTKNYGPTFLEALPDCTVRHGTLTDLPQAARDWLARSST